MSEFTPKQPRLANGFTLIEVLVVIAIIAILNAILFPVFHQVRIAREQTTCLSNQKQLGIAFMLYAQDYDEILFPWANGTLNAVTIDRECTIGSWKDVVYWPQLIQPYVKTRQTFTCPGNGYADDGEYLRELGYPPDTMGLPLDYVRACFVDFGYNQYYLSPRNSARIFAGVSLSAIGQPAATILGAESSCSHPYANTTVGKNYVDAPSVAVWTLTGDERWYGNVAPRHHEMANVLFTDGHAKSMTIIELNTGFDPVRFTITDPESYLWGLR